LNGVIPLRLALRLRMQELEEDLRMERHLDMNPYDPWGKAGGGAPNRDADGNIISNLRGHVGIRYPRP
jgi:hypothetical protein